MLDNDVSTVAELLFSSSFSRAKEEKGFLKEAVAFGFVGIQKSRVELIVYCGEEGVMLFFHFYSNYFHIVIFHLHSIRQDNK